jgi:hypothetical protein
MLLRGEERRRHALLERKKKKKKEEGGGMKKKNLSPSSRLNCLSLLCSLLQESTHDMKRAPAQMAGVESKRQEGKALASLGARERKQ